MPIKEFYLDRVLRDLAMTQAQVIVGHFSVDFLNLIISNFCWLCKVNDTFRE